MAADVDRHLVRQHPRRSSHRASSERAVPAGPRAPARPVPELAGEQGDLPAGVAGCRQRQRVPVLPDSSRAQRIQPGNHRPAEFQVPGPARRPGAAPGRIRARGAADVQLPDPAPGSGGRARLRQRARSPRRAWFRRRDSCRRGRVMVRSLAPLRHRRFRLLVGGQLASNVGDAFYAVALPGTVLAAYGVPRTVLLAVGGHASDRWRPWTVMMTSDSVRAVAVAALAVAAASGPARAVVLVPIAAVLGAGEGLFLPGSFAIVPVLLPDEELQSGNALASAVTQLATLAGPAIGGALVALAGPAPAFAVDAATFAVSALTLAGVRSAQRSAMVTGTGPVAAPVTVPGAEEGSLQSAVEP